MTNKYYTLSWNTTKNKKTTKHGALMGYSEAGS